MSELTVLVGLLLSYLLGSLSSAIIVCRLFRLTDPRTTGSHNPGATNVLRSGNKLAALITLLGDALKGVIPVLIATGLGASPTVVGLVMLAALLGHMYPVFFAFKGGKGVATALGCLLGLSWSFALLSVATWLVIAAIFRYSSLAALVSSALTPFYAYWLLDRRYVPIMALIAVLIIVRHRKNIANLLSSRETKVK